MPEQPWSDQDDSDVSYLSDTDASETAVLYLQHQAFAHWIQLHEARGQEKYIEHYGAQRFLITTTLLDLNHWRNRALLADQTDRELLSNERDGRRRDRRCLMLITCRETMLTRLALWSWSKEARSPPPVVEFVDTLPDADPVV